MKLAQPEACPGSLYDNDLLNGSDVLDEHADRVVLEVTEGTPLGEVDDPSARLDRLRARGYRLAVDDFGAGYNGLTTFASMQPDVVKFDKELIRDVGHSSTRRRIVSSMVELCREMDILSLAEGIETDDDYHHLLGLGCDLFQGYAIGKPADDWTTATIPS